MNIACTVVLTQCFDVVKPLDDTLDVAYAIAVAVLEGSCTAVKSIAMSSVAAERTRVNLKAH